MSEVKSFLAGMLFLYGVETMLPLFGIKFALTTTNALMNFALACIAIAAAYYLFRN